MRPTSSARSKLEEGLLSSTEYVSTSRIAAVPATFATLAESVASEI
jgi:hypothetical protein